MTKTSYPLRLDEDERARAKRVADALGISENRLYAELIHDGLLMHEQRLYLQRLRELAATSDKSAALAVLDKAADQPPLPSDR